MNGFFAKSNLIETTCLHSFLPSRAHAHVLCVALSYLQIWLSIGLVALEFMAIQVMTFTSSGGLATHALSAAVTCIAASC